MRRHPCFSKVKSDSALSPLHDSFTDHTANGSAIKPSTPCLHVHLKIEKPSKLPVLFLRDTLSFLLPLSGSSVLHFHWSSCVQLIKIICRLPSPDHNIGLPSFSTLQVLVQGAGLPFLSTVPHRVAVHHSNGINQGGCTTLPFIPARIAAFSVTTDGLQPHRDPLRPPCHRPDPVIRPLILSFMAPYESTQGSILQSSTLHHSLNVTPAGYRDHSCFNPNLTGQHNVDAS